jgi:hypothetical protein
MDQNGMAFNARPRPRPPRREYVATIGTEELGRYAGVGLTLERVIEEELRKIGYAKVAAEPVEASDDVVIWQGNKAVALVRINTEGRPVVTRFDRPQGGTAKEPVEPGEGPFGVILGKRLYVAVPGEVRSALVVLDLERVGRLTPAGEVVPAVGAESSGPKKPRPGKGAVSRKPSPRRKPGWGQR